MARSQPSASFFKQVVSATDDYLGPASERFISRQVEHHLNKQPSELKKKDLPHLIQWIRLAMGLVIDDQQMIEDYIATLRQLSKS